MLCPSMRQRDDTCIGANNIHAHQSLYNYNIVRVYIITYKCQRLPSRLASSTEAAVYHCVSRLYKTPAKGDVSQSETSPFIASTVTLCHAKGHTTHDIVSCHADFLHIGNRQDTIRHKPWKHAQKMYGTTVAACRATTLWKMCQ